MKRLVLFVLCFAVFCCSALSFTCSAADDSDEGYLWDEEGGFWYIPKSEAADEETTTRRSGPLRAPAASGAGTTIAFPDFDKNKIDVAGFPDYVKQIIASPTSFTWVIVFQNTFYIYVADGCFPGVASLTGNLFIVNAALSVDSQKGYFVNAGYNPYVYACYVGHYSWSSSDTLYSDFYDSDSWQAASFKKVNRDTTDKYFYTYPIPTSLAKKVSDFYCFGSVVFRSDLSRFYYPLASGGNMQTITGSWSDTVSGYNKWIYDFSSGESKFRFIDGGTFPTAESQQAETQRGILGQLKALPDKIKAFFDSLFDKIKGLFIPSDGFFDTYFNDLKTFFASRFGFLYDLPAAVVTIFNQLINFEPDESGYHIHFPEVSAPVIMEGISGVGWQRIISEQDYYFDFLDNAPFSTLYAGYRAFVWLAYCFMLINLAKSKAENIFGGK